MERDEKRAEPRARVSIDGFFITGATLWEVKLLDSTSEGVGALCNREFQPGDRGVLSARLPSSDEQENIFSEVRWCERDPYEKNPFLPYRLGLHFLGTLVSGHHLPGCRNCCSGQGGNHLNTHVCLLWFDFIMDIEPAHAGRQRCIGHKRDFSAIFSGMGHGDVIFAGSERALRIQQIAPFPEQELILFCAAAYLHTERAIDIGDYAYNPHGAPECASVRCALLRLQSDGSGAEWQADMGF